MAAVVNAAKGTLTPQLGRQGGVTLTLKGLERQAVWFSDRPSHLSGAFPSSGIAAAWNGFGFTSDPPNAALDYTDPTRGPGHTVVLELGRPRYHHGALTFDARIIDPTTITGGNLAGHARRADRTPPRTLTSATLFIDDTAAPFVGGCMIQPDTNCVGAMMFDANLSGVDLTGANLAVAQLFHDNLDDANLTDSNLTNVTWSNTSLIGTNFTGSTLYRDNLTGQKLAGANLADATLTYVDLTRADLAGGRLTGASFMFGSADHTNLTKVDMTDANLYGTFFVGANLTGANLAGANVGATRFTGATFCRTTMPNGSINNSGC